MSVIPVIIPKTRKGLIILLAVLFVICAGAAVFTYFSWSSDQQALKTSGQPDFNTLSEADLKGGLIVKGTIDIALDAYVEDYETTVGIRFSDNSEALYYLVPIYDMDKDGYITFKYLITYKAEPKDFDAMNDIATNFWNGGAELKTLTIDNAKIVDLPAENKRLFAEWASTPNYYEGGSFYDWCAETLAFGTDDRAAIESKFVPYMIQKTATAGTDPVVMWILAGAAGLCLIILAVVLIRKKPISGVANNTGDPDIMRPMQ